MCVDSNDSVVWGSELRRELLLTEIVRKDSVPTMSLAIAFKGPEGIVLAADSRVTLSAAIQIPGQAQSLLLPATFDNATKLFKIRNHKFVGAVTYGNAAIGLQQPRTAHSFLPEFEATLAAERMQVRVFAERLSQFFLEKWISSGMPSAVPAGQDMVFLVGGYDEGSPYGCVFEVVIPSRPAPVEQMNQPGSFGIVWGGQKEITERLLNGGDQKTAQVAREFLHVPLGAAGPDPLAEELKRKLSAKIPWQFLPLQDCVDLSIFLIKTTVTLQRWLVDVRGVGGHIDVATITPTDGFVEVQRKKIVGEFSNK